MPFPCTRLILLVSKTPLHLDHCLRLLALPCNSPGPVSAPTFFLCHLPSSPLKMPGTCPAPGALPLGMDANPLGGSSLALPLAWALCCHSLWQRPLDPLPPMSLAGTANVLIVSLHQGQEVEALVCLKPICTGGMAAE